MNGGPLQSPPMAVDATRFRHTLGKFASGVTVVTTEHEGEQAGITVSAFSSLSLEPPLVLICIDRKVRSHDVIAGAGLFAVNILEASQEEVSRRFASRQPDKFAGIATHRSPSGLPLIDGALATLECRVKETLPGGDHTIFVGEVLDSQLREGDPLVYFHGAYRALK